MFIKAGRVCLTLGSRTALLIGTIEDVEVVLINAVAAKDIDDEFQECGLAHTSLSDEKDGVWCLNLILRRLDEPLPDRLHNAGPYDQEQCNKEIIITHLIARGVLSSLSRGPADSQSEGTSSLKNHPSQ